MMVELLGGEIGFDSILGEGSTFWFTLPLQISRRAPPPVAPDIFVAGLIANDVQRAAIHAQLGYLQIPSSLYSSFEQLLAWCQHEGLTGKCRTFLLIDADTLSNSEQLLKNIVSDFAANECELVCVSWKDAHSNRHDDIGGSFLTLPVTYKKLLTMVESKHSKSRSDEKPAKSCNNAFSYRILLVEDSPALQLVAKAMLTKLGVQVQLEINGREAVEAVRNGDFDLVLMDIQMPVMDGITATRHIRNLQAPEKAQIPIVALTAYAMKGDDQQFLEAGMNDYLTKPIRLDQLPRIFDRWLPGFDSNTDITD
jgi:CheY-like chemotaxis protein